MECHITKVHIHVDSGYQYIIVIQCQIRGVWVCHLQSSGIDLSISLYSCDPHIEVHSSRLYRLELGKNRRTLKDSSHFADSMWSKLKFLVSFWVFTSKEIKASHC